MFDNYHYQLTMFYKYNAEPIASKYFNTKTLTNYFLKEAKIKYGKHHYFSIERYITPSGVSPTSIVNFKNETLREKGVLIEL